MRDYSNIEIHAYPGYNEYLLVDNLVNSEIVFKRGFEKSLMLDNVEFRIWQDFFCSYYSPPKEKNVLLLHMCSWAKPYDYSFTINKIKRVADKFPFVHRCILSNAGLIPYEFQMNPTFCSYDYNPSFVGNNIHSLRTIKAEYYYNLYECIYKYLNSHREKYEAVVLNSIPLNILGNAKAVKSICEKLDIPAFIAPSPELYSKLRKRNKTMNLEELLVSPEVLEQLEAILNSFL